MVLILYVQYYFICTWCGNERYIPKFTIGLSGECFNWQLIHINMQSLQRSVSGGKTSTDTIRKGLGLGLQGLYSATNCTDNILGRFTMILQNRQSRLIHKFNKKMSKIHFIWYIRHNRRKIYQFCRLNASISSHNLISFGNQFHARGTYTANARLPKVSCLNFGTFRVRSSLDLMEYLLLFDGVIIS